MPGRISRSSLPKRAPSTSKKSNKKRKERGLNAFAIAQHEAPERTKIKQHRLGEQEDEGPRRKRQRTADEDEDEDEADSSAAKRQHRKNGRADDLDIDSGSDSEGHEWRLGVVADDDDSDLDSEMAFGESDEERFEGFTFRGSAGGKKQSNKRRTIKPAGSEPDLNEADELEDEEDEDDLGEDAIDLAAMLDASEEDSDDDSTAGSKQERQPRKQSKKTGAGSQEGDLADFGEAGDALGSDEEDAPSEYDDDDEASDFSVSEAGTDDNNPEKLKQLRNVVTSLAQDHASSGDAADADREESSAVAARMLNALKGMSGVDPALMRSVKTLSRGPGSSKPTKDSQMVKVPLPKRQQDRIDRGVAYDKAKETLNRWIDTVKHNRRAEHLSFPLQDPHAQEAQGTTRLLPTTASKPRTELESTIQDIMQASGLAVNNGKSEEDQIRGFEELQSNKMPLEEVLARRAELRKARDLLFREEARSKRIKKIKSKSFRRVHRKEAQREAQKERDLLSAAGVELSEDEQEANDRRRAEERMGARHRESKWAKSVKQTGRAAWDEDARDGVADMARRNEDLRKRMEGKRIRNEDESASDFSDDSEDDASDEFGDDAEGFKLRRQLDKVDSTGQNDGAHSKLSALKFMQRADAARKRQNDTDADRLRRDLDGEESPSEAEEEINIGRKIFGPTEKTTQQTTRPKRNELEEPESSDSDNDDRVLSVAKLTSQAQPVNQSKAAALKANQRTKKDRLPQPPAKAKAFVAGLASGQKAEASSETEEVDTTNILDPTRPTMNTAAGNTNGWTTVQYTSNSASKNIDEAHSDAENADLAENPLVPSNLDLVRAAFGGDDVEAAFAAEKDEAAASEDEKTVNNALPGWGSWTGDGVSKRELKRVAQRNKDRFITKVADGVKPAERKDKRLKDVIISERRVKKNAKYLAEKLPHPFESRQQYERSLRIPIGPEWTTKETFQNATKPRVLVKAGRVIAPMQEPMI